MDIGQRATEREYAAMIRKLEGVYEEARSDLNAKASSFKHAHESRVQKYRAQVAEGVITEADFRAWMQGQLFQERAWKKKQQQLAEAMAEVDGNALSMIHSGKMKVFAENANYLEWQIERRVGRMQANFGLYNVQTVSRLIRDEPRLLPMPKLDVGKDVAWYNHLIGNAVTQGIIQGEDLEGIVFRVSLEAADKGLSSMRRNCRTAYTGAQNAGRVEAMRQAERAGIEVKKQWIATLDSHTRDAHGDLDGQIVGKDEPFQSMLGPIMYPGDPNADPANVYNCRCTLGWVYPRYDRGMGKRRDQDGEMVDDMSYREWKQYKARNGAGDDVD